MYSEEFLINSLSREIAIVKNLKMNFMNSEEESDEEDEQLFDYIIREKEHIRRELEERLISKKNEEPKEARVKILPPDDVVLLVMDMVEPIWYSFGFGEHHDSIVKKQETLSFNSVGEACELKDKLPAGYIYGVFKKI